MDKMTNNTTTKFKKIELKKDIKKLAPAERRNGPLHLARARLVRPVHERDIRAGTSGSERDGLADAARRACDEHRPPGQ